MRPSAKKVDIHEGIESTLTLVAHELKRRVKVTKELGAVRGDRMLS